jgi:hypothetical protein
MRMVCPVNYQLAFIHKHKNGYSLDRGIILERKDEK